MNTSTWPYENGTMTSLQHPSVLISGASFAGLATAFWLHKLGYAVTIVEVSSNLKKGGTPVDIREGVIDVVKRMGLLDRISSTSLKDRPMAFLDADGAPVAVMPAREGTQGAPMGYEVERDALLDMLFGEVKENVEVIFNDSISGLEQSSEEVAVTFTNGNRRSFSLVLGCDGTHSVVRKICFGEESSFSLFMQNYFGLSIVNKLLIAENTGQMFNVPGKTVMLNAYNNKTDIAFCFFSEQELAYDRRDSHRQRDMIRQQFEGEGWRVSELLKEMARCNNFYFDKLCQIRMKSWSKGRVALVGDAAYCPSPAAGMGGSMAILGAAALADALRNYPGDFEMAFKEYDRSFRPIADEIQANAIEFGMALVMPRTEEAIQRRNLQFGNLER
jgi:2-polyprenyl-6-methoxyphenol hydroxylase-like FAD-dependent oxidoreductase